MSAIIDLCYTQIHDFFFKFIIASKVRAIYLCLFYYLFIYVYFIVYLFLIYLFYISIYLWFEVGAREQPNLRQGEVHICSLWR